MGRISWITRHRGEKWWHLIYGYQRRLAGETSLYSLSEISVPGSTETGDGPDADEPQLLWWILKPAEYRGRCRALFAEYGQDSRRDDSRYLLVYQEAKVTEDYAIIALLRQHSIELKDQKSYHSYQDFLEDGHFLLEDIWLDRKSQLVSMQARLGEYGFTIEDTNYPSVATRGG